MRWFLPEHPKNSEQYFVHLSLELVKRRFQNCSYTVIICICLEGYPSGSRGRFAKSLEGSNLLRGFESLLLRQIKRSSLSGSFYLTKRKCPSTYLLVLHGKWDTKQLFLRMFRTVYFLSSNRHHFCKLV